MLGLYIVYIVLKTLLNKARYKEMLTYLINTQHNNIYSLLTDSDPIYHFRFHSIQKAQTMHLQIHMIEYAETQWFLGILHSCQNQSAPTGSTALYSGKNYFTFHTHIYIYIYIYILYSTKLCFKKVQDLIIFVF